MVDAIAAAIAGVTDEPITHVVYSHYHHDHIGGAGQLAPGATFVAHAATAVELERAGDPDRPVPTVTFDDETTPTVGTQVSSTSSWRSTSTCSWAATWVATARGRTWRTCTPTCSSSVTTRAPTIPGWVDRLGGADVWTKQSCFAMIQSLRID